jgi:putative transposase
MSNLRRFYVKGQPYFITCVTFERMPCLLDNVDLLRRAIKKTNTALPHDVLAWVVLPDHWHAVIDPKECTISDIMHRIKLKFVSRYLQKHDLRRGRVWQNRFWDHVVRNERELRKYLDYIHYNPVSHGLVASPFDHPESSIHLYAVNGYYHNDWGVREKIEFEGDYGE